MLTFGTATLIDLLSWIVVVTLGSKVIATAILLVVDKSARDRPGWGSLLWWVTKLTPVITVPCVIWIARLEHDRDLLRVALGLAAFVAFAVPLKIRERRKRIMRHPAMQLLPS